MESAASRRFYKEITTFIDKLVKVVLDDEEKVFYVGNMAGVDLRSLTLCLVNAKNQNGQSIPKILLHGSNWRAITLEEEPFPLENLYERINATFPPGQVQFLDDSGVISILNGKIKVTQEGVEGAGPTKDHVQRVYDQFMSELES